MSDRPVLHLPRREIENLPRKDPRNTTIGANVLTRTKIKVHHHRELVEITLGGTTLKIHYSDAFPLSMLIRGHAKQAKKFNGDGSQHWSGWAALTDAEENYKHGR